MTTTYSNVNIATDNFDVLMDRVNSMLADFRTKVVTTNSNTATGNAAVTGQMVAARFIAPLVTTNVVTSNVVTSLANVTTNTVFANNVVVSQFLTANGAVVSNLVANTGAIATLSANTVVVTNGVTANGFSTTGIVAASEAKLKPTTSNASVTLLRADDTAIGKFSAAANTVNITSLAANGTTTQNKITLGTANTLFTFNDNDIWHNGNFQPGTKQDISTLGQITQFRNKIINGDFYIWQRAGSQTSSGYGSDDRWINGHFGSTKTHSRVAFTPGQTDVPGNPRSFSRTVVNSVAGAGNYVEKMQYMESVHELAGKTVTVTLYAKADANRNMAVDIFQYFGPGGSTAVEGIGKRLLALTTSWQKFTFTATLPSIAGKTIPSYEVSSTTLRMWFDAGSTYGSVSSSLGQQSGTFDIARVSVVEGDATTEVDPFSPRPQPIELILCQRYYEITYVSAYVYMRNVTVSDLDIQWGQANFAVSKRVPPSITFDYVYTNGTVILGDVSPYHVIMQRNGNFNSPLYVKIYANAEMT